MLKIAGFDLDDTLYSHWGFEKALLGEIAAMIASKFGVPPETIYQEMKKLFDRRQHSALFDNAFLNAGYPLPVGWKTFLKDQILPFYRTHKPVIQLTPFDWVRPLLTELRSRSGLKSVLITNGGVDIQNNKIDLLCIRDLFDYIYISDQFTPPERKPCTKIFRRVLDDLREDAESMVYVGDCLEIDGSCSRLGIRFLPARHAQSLRLIL